MLCSIVDGNTDHNKQAQITFNLFHFSRHRVPYQDDEKRGRLYGKQGGLIDSFVEFLLTFTQLSDEHRGLSKVCTLFSNGITL